MKTETTVEVPIDELLRGIRKETGDSKKMMARKLDVSPEYLERIEENHDIPLAEMQSFFEKVAEVYAVPEDKEPTAIEKSFDVLLEAYNDFASKKDSEMAKAASQLDPHKQEENAKLYERTLYSYGFLMGMQVMAYVSSLVATGAEKNGEPVPSDVAKRLLKDEYTHAKKILDKEQRGSLF